LRKNPGPLRPSPNRACLSWSCSTLQRKPPNRASTPMGWVLPSCPSSRQDGLQGLHAIRCRRHSKENRRRPLMGFCSPAESSELRAAASLPRPLGREPRTTAPPMRFLTPTASPRTWQQLGGRVCLARPLASSGFLDLSTPSSASCLPAIFQAGSAPGVEPFRAFLLPCSRTPFPAPAPLVALNRSEDRPRLQGLAPHESPTPDGRGLTPPPARSSPGLSALQGSLPRCRGPAFAEPPLLGFSPRGANDPRRGPPRFRQQRDRLVSRETADPPGLPCLLTFHERSGRSPARKSPPPAPGCVAVPCRAVFEPSNRPCRSRS